MHNAQWQCNAQCNPIRHELVERGTAQFGIITLKPAIEVLHQHGDAGERFPDAAAQRMAKR
jgi:hypothetical protein